MKPTDIHSGLTAERVREVLDYEPETGVLRWRVSRGGVVAGRVAGAKNSGGYICVWVGGRGYKAHRLVWLHMYGEWPDNDIDHINGRRDDNRAENLRDVSRQVNAQNRRKARHGAVINTSNTGLLGASFDRERRLFIAAIQDPVARKNIYLGSYATAEEAHQVYLKAKRKIHEGCTI